MAKNNKSSVGLGLRMLDDPQAVSPNLNPPHSFSQQRTNPKPCYCKASTYDSMLLTPTCGTQLLRRRQCQHITIVTTWGWCYLFCWPGRRTWYQKSVNCNQDTTRSSECCDICVSIYLCWRCGCTKVDLGLVTKSLSARQAVESTRQSPLIHAGMFTTITACRIPL